MITKLATFRGVSPEGEPLVRLFEPGGRLIKEAGSIMPQIKQWLAAYQPESGKIAVLVNAMGASEYWGQNVNGDVFPERALLHDCRNHPESSHPIDDFTGKVLPAYGYWTFLNAHPFVHHRNKDPNRAFGHVALACWNPRMHRVELIVILDKMKAMQHGAQHVIDRILAGEFPDVSMGCRVPYDVCTICGNKSKTRNDYCSCVKLIGMNKILDDGRRIGVINLHPRFFDISFVFIGADKTAKVMCKLASGLIVPQSVADAEELYGPMEGDLLVKAASVQVPSNFYLEKKAEPRIAGVPLDVSDKILELGLTSIESDGKKVTVLKKSAPPPEEESLLFSRTDEQKDPQNSSISDGALQTNASVGEGEDDERGGVTPIKQAASARGRVASFYLKRAIGEDPGSPPGNVDQRQKVMDHYRKKVLTKAAALDPAIANEASALLASLGGVIGGSVAAGVVNPKSVKDAIGPVTVGTMIGSTLGAGAGFLSRKKIPNARLDRSMDTYKKVLDLWGQDTMKRVRTGLVAGGVIGGVGGGVIHGVASGKKKKASEEGGTTPPLERVVHFLKVHPNPTDDQLHEWAEAHGFNVHEVERLTYRLATAKAKEASGLTGVFEQAKRITIGGPPSPNRKEHPFVGTINFRGLIIHVENKPGSVREGKTPEGKVKWRTHMKLPYGEIKGSLGTDGDKLDVYVGPFRNAPNVYIIHQNFVRGPRQGKYDEDKVMVGFEDAEQAKEAYLAHYDSRKYFRSVTVMAFPLFKKAVMKKEVHGEKVAAAYQQVVTDMKLEDEFYVKEAARSTGYPHSYKSFGEAAEAAAEINAELPEDMVPLLGLVPRFDEISKQYILSYRPLSKEMMKELFLKHGSAMQKFAARADLSHLFQNEKNARRRERTWRDKVTGKETTEIGSGLNKTASAPSPEVMKVATILHSGWTPADLLKVSNELKAASHLKWADIVKRIGPSKAVGRVTPLLSQTEETLPKDILNELGQKPDLEKSLATPSLMGMVLKPEEFQRIILCHLGKDSLADKLDDAGAVFKPSDDEAQPCGALSSDHMDSDVMKSLLPFLEGKSYMGPIVRRRIIRISVSKPKPEEPSTEVESPLLSKVSAAYTWYRREHMKLARDLPATVSSHPELHAGVYGLDPEDIFNKTAAGELPLDRKSIALLLGTVPLTLMYSAHKRGQQRRGEDIGVLGDLIADHPWLTSMGVVTGLGAALRNPKAQQAIDELFGAGKRIWEGKQGPVPALQ